MNEKLHWWQQDSRFLNETLPFINESRASDEAIGRCEKLCKALNKTWNAFYQYRSRIGQLNETELEKGRSDTQSFRELLLQGISEKQTKVFCESENLAQLANLTPRIMDHDTLLKLRYDPDDISEDVRKKASDEHRQLFNALQHFLESPSDQSLREALLKKTAQIIYVVRSNIAHSEKTPHGPDLAKSERDQVVSEATTKVIEDVFNIFLDRPSQRLAVYGTLTPEQPNAQELSGLEGEWHEATVRGTMQKRDGFQEFVWSLPGEDISVKVLSCPELNQRFNRLDQFEGPRYSRILVPAMIDGTVCVSNIYQARH